MNNDRDKYDNNVNPFLNPIPFLESLKGKEVVVKLKWGYEYSGKLISYDNYLNVQVS